MVHHTHIPSVEILSQEKTKQLAKLKMKKYRLEEEICVVEGVRLIGQLLSNGIIPESIIIQNNESTQLSPDLLANIPLYSASMAQISRISDAEHPQPMLAVMPCQVKPLSNDGFLLYVDRIKDPGNLGTIFRTAAASQIDGVVLSPDCCELFNPKVVRSSLGSVFFVPTMIQGYEWLDQFEGSKIGLAMQGSMDLFQASLPKGKILLAVGSEADGLHPEALKRMDSLVRIPIHQQMESLNAAVSASIGIYVLRHGK